MGNHENTKGENIKVKVSRLQGGSDWDGAEMRVRSSFLHSSNRQRAVAPNLALLRISNDWAQYKRVKGTWVSLVWHSHNWYGISH